MDDSQNNFRINKPLIVFLLVIDSIFILLHFYNSAMVPDEHFNPMFSLVDDSGIAEKFQYLKWLFIAILFVFISFKESTIKYITWTLLFLYLLFDDSLKIHETYGAYLVQNTTITAPFGLRMQDLGELLVTAIAGGVLFTLLAWAFVKGDILFRRITNTVILLIVVLAIFGVGIDMLHQIADSGRLGNFIFEVVEDGGEMFIASIIFWYVFNVSNITNIGNNDVLSEFSLEYLSKKQAAR